MNLPAYQMNEADFSHYFMMLAEKSNAVFWVRSPDRATQIYVNRAFESIWGITPQELYKNPKLWEDSIHPEDRTHVLNILETRPEEIDHEDFIILEYRIYHKSGKMRWIKDRVFPLFDQNNKLIAYSGIAEDVSYEKQNQALMKEKQEAEDSNKAKADFLATMSHELRTPLNAILGMTQILKNKVKESSSQEYLDVIYQSGNHLLILMNDILDFARLEAGKIRLKKEAFDLEHLIEETIRDFNIQNSNKDIELNYHYDPKLPKKFIGDAHRVRQIIDNLIGNAFKFTQKGSIKVSLKKQASQNSRTLIKLSVEDTGIGIATDKLDIIFERFKQIDTNKKNLKQGVGLGLAIVKQLSELMGGKAGVMSEVNEGSTFWSTFALKKVKPENDKGADDQSKTQNLDLHNKHYKVLLVEDSIVNQKVMKLFLEEIHCEVDIAGTGKEALRLLNSQHDLILMDVSLPDMNGCDATRSIRTHNKYDRLPIVAITAHVFEEDKQKCLESGMNYVLNKPVSKDQLLYILQRYVDKE